MPKCKGFPENTRQTSNYLKCIEMIQTSSVHRYAYVLSNVSKTLSCSFIEIHNCTFLKARKSINFYVLSYMTTTCSILTRLTPGKLKEFCRSHADLSCSFLVYYSELRSAPVFSQRSSVIISKAPD